MEKRSELFFDELIKLEQNAQKLYLLFSEKLNKFSNFWYKLSIEEANHASMIETSKLFYENNITDGKYIDYDIIDGVIKTNKLFIDLTDNFLNDQTIDNAINIGLLVESSVGEQHYEKILTDINDNDKFLCLFKRLNKGDIDHYNRIKELQYSIDKL